MICFVVFPCHSDNYGSIIIYNTATLYHINFSRYIFFFFHNI